MKLSLRAMISAVALLLCGIGMGQAEEIRLSPQFDPFAESSAAPPEVSLVNYAEQASVSGAEAAATYRPSVNNDFLANKNRYSGLIAGSEVIFLRPYSSGYGLTSLDFFGLGFGTVQGAQLGFEPTSRNWIGYQSASGLGGRFRYWQFDRGNSNYAGIADLIAAGDDGVAMTDLGLQFRTIDLEVTQAVDFRRWNLLIAGGVRYAQSQVARTDISVDTGVLDEGFTSKSSFNGVGLTTALQVARDLNQSGSWRMTIAGRWSGLYGNNKTALTLFDAGSGTVIDSFYLAKNNSVINIFELNIGPQYRRRLQNGSFLTLSSGIEAQTWTNSDGGGGLFGFAGLGILGQGDIGLTGFSTSLSITR